MLIQKQQLIDVLTAVRPALAKKAMIEQATHFIFCGDKILSYNDRICIAIPFKTDFVCSISADEFYKILTSITQEEIDIKLIDQKLKITAKKLNVTLTTETGNAILNMIETLDLDNIPKLLRPLPTEFREAVSLCSFSAAKDMSNPILTCIFVNDNKVASSDNLRISEYTLSRSIRAKFLLPATSAIELVKFELEKFAISPTNNWVYFTTKAGAIFCSRLMDNNYPDYTQFLSSDDGIEIILPDETRQLVETAAILASGDDDQNKEVEISIDDGKLKCRGENKLGWIESESDIKTTQSIEFIINPIFLLMILIHTHTMCCDGSKTIFTSGNFKHAIALKAKE